MAFCLVDFSKTHQARQFALNPKKISPCPLFFVYLCSFERIYGCFCISNTQNPGKTMNIYERLVKTMLMFGLTLGATSTIAADDYDKIFRVSHGLKAVSYTHL